MVVATVEKDLCKIWEVKTLGKERDAGARKLLEDAAKQVQPIMRKRKWQVPLLAEFCPKDPNLLGLNVDGGQKIMVRVRRFGHESEFYPYESILGTLLHELTHNECGPHDAKFYKLLDEITTECEVLMAKGISGTGEGFDAPGKRLGGTHHNPPTTGLRQAALAAAEKRARTGALMPSGPRRLGGDSSIMKDLSPVQAAAMAAERRQRDDVWCAAPQTCGKDGFEKAEEVVEAAEVHPPSVSQQDEVVNTVGKPPRSSLLTSSIAAARKGKAVASEEEQVQQNTGWEAKAKVAYEPVHPSGPLPQQQSEWHGNGSSSSSQQQSDYSPAGSWQPAEDMWACSLCTLLNPALAVVCGACGTEVNSQGSQQTWTCSKCTLVNSGFLQSCEACGGASWKLSSSSSSSAFNPETAIIVRPEPAVIPCNTLPPLATAAPAGGSKASPPAALGGVSRDSRTWTCGQCTLENTVLLTSCEACDTWRFSHGPPVAARAPAGT